MLGNLCSRPVWQPTHPFSWEACSPLTLDRAKELRDEYREDIMRATVERTGAVACVELMDGCDEETAFTHVAAIEKMHGRVSGWESVAKEEL